jgi:hypothetical protein
VLQAETHGAGKEGMKKNMNTIKGAAGGRLTVARKQKPFISLVA